MMRRLCAIVLASLIALGIWGSQPAWAGQLDDRLQQFPQWQGKPSVRLATTELTYPSWLAGEWRVTNTLVDLVAPLAPALVTPGFEGNR